MTRNCKAWSAQHCQLSAAQIRPKQQLQSKVGDSPSVTRHELCSGEAVVAPPAASEASISTHITPVMSHSRKFGMMRQQEGSLFGLRKRTFGHGGLAVPNTSILGLQNPIAIAFSLATGLRNMALPYDF